MKNNKSILLQARDKKQPISKTRFLKKRIKALEKLISGHKELEEILIKEGDAARKYLDMAEIIFVEIGKKGQINYLNKKGCDILSYKSPLSAKNLEPS